MKAPIDEDVTTLPVSLLNHHGNNGLQKESRLSRRLMKIHHSSRPV